MSGEQDSFDFGTALADIDWPKLTADVPTFTGPTDGLPRLTRGAACYVCGLHFGPGVKHHVTLKTYLSICEVCSWVTRSK